MVYVTCGSLHYPIDVWRCSRFYAKSLVLLFKTQAWVRDSPWTQTGQQHRSARVASGQDCGRTHRQTNSEQARDRGSRGTLPHSSHYATDSDMGQCYFYYSLSLIRFRCCCIGGSSRYISRSSAVRPTLQTLSPIQSSASFSQGLFVSLAFQ